MHTPFLSHSKYDIAFTMDDHIYEGRNSYSAADADFYRSASQKSLDEEHMRLLMHLRLRSTFADAKFTEQSAIRSPRRDIHTDNDLDLNDIFETMSESHHSSVCSNDHIMGTNTNRASTRAQSTPDSTFIKETTGSTSPSATTNTNGIRVGETKYNTYNNASRLASALRGIASKLEQNTSRSRRKRNILEQQLEQVMQDWEYSRIQWQEERKHLESCIEVLQNRTNNLQEQLNAKTDLPSPETYSLPLKVLQIDELEDSSRIQMDRIKSLLYCDSSGPIFLSSLYRCIRCYPEILSSKTFIDHVTDAIRLDANPLDFNNVLSDAPQQLYKDGYEDGAYRKYSSVGAYANEYDTRRFSVAASVDASSGDLAHVYDGRNAPGLNLYTLACIMRHSSIDALYRYLFAALECDNCRVVEVILDAVGQKFLNFDFAGEHCNNVLHPLLVPFGRARPSQAFRYLKMVDYDFSKWPLDPNTGDGLWHFAVTSKSTRVLHTLKNFGVYFDYIEAPNYEGKSALDVCSPKIKKELIGCMVIECAARGSECYKVGNYKGALDWYTKAILKQNLCDPSDPPVSFANIGKIHYNRARALVHLNRWTEAIDSCNACLEHIPSYYGGWETLIEAHRNLLDWQAAHASYCGMVDACNMEQPLIREAIENQLNATLFQWLQVPITATAVDIKTAFKQQCKLWHPDKFMGQGDVNPNVLRQCTNHFGRLVDARDGLLDATTRAMETLKKPTNYIPPTPPQQNGTGNQ